MRRTLAILQINDLLLVSCLIIMCLGVAKISRLENENEKLNKELSNQKNKYEKNIDDLEESINTRESEIKYWGIKYDSIKQILN